MPQNLIFSFLFHKLWGKLSNQKNHRIITYKKWFDNFIATYNIKDLQNDYSQVSWEILMLKMDKLVHQSFFKGSFVASPQKWIIFPKKIKSTSKLI